LEKKMGCGRLSVGIMRVEGMPEYADTAYE
jgi:hypothetical protein